MKRSINDDKKILLVSANQHQDPYPVYPLGLSYISAHLKESLPAYEIKIFDFNFKNLQEFEEELKQFNPRFVGVSLRNVDSVNSMNNISFINGYRLIIDKAKAYGKSITVIGGAGFSIFPELIYKKLMPDFGVYGEGEVSFKRLIETIDNGTNDFKSIDSLLYNQKEATCFNKRNGYFKSPSILLDNPTIDYYWQQSGMLNIQTKRGCPYHCVYCTYPLIEGRTVRTLDPEKIVDSLAQLNQEKKINYVFFTDSVFNIKNNFNRELSEKLIQSGLKIRWGAYFAPTSNLVKEDLSLYKRAGLTHVEFGTESLCDEQLVNYGKSFLFEDVLEKSNFCRELNIYYAHFLILGGYGETDETLNKSFANSKKIDRSVFFPFVGMRIYPGTKLQELAIKEGVIVAQDDLLEPKYYISNKIDIPSMKDRAEETGKAWVFPDKNFNKEITFLRERNKKGPLWEFIVK